MGSTFASIDDKLTSWIAEQHLFFVATAPRSASGRVNCSPKGGKSLRVLGPNAVAYLDGAGSGIETVSHLRENGRLVIMFCAFDGAPRIVRLHGMGTVIVPNDPLFSQLLADFPPHPTVRSIIHLAVERVSDSCGYGVPFMDFRVDRNDSKAYLRKSSDTALHNYLLKNNQASIDGLPGLSAEELKNLVVNRE
jgi:hypothetical protein